jgi:Protein kinase domain
MKSDSEQADIERPAVNSDSEQVASATPDDLRRITREYAELPKLLRRTTSKFEPFWETSRDLEPLREEQSLELEDEQLGRAQKVLEESTKQLSSLGVRRGYKFNMQQWAAALKTRPSLAVDLAVCGFWTELEALLSHSELKHLAASTVGEFGWLALHHAARGAAPVSVIAALLEAHPEGLESRTQKALDGFTKTEVTLGFCALMVLIICQLSVWPAFTVCIVFFAPLRKPDEFGCLFGIVVGLVVWLIPIMTINLNRSPPCYRRALIRLASVLPKSLTFEVPYELPVSRRLPLELATSIDVAILLAWCGPQTIACSAVLPSMTTDYDCILHDAVLSDWQRVRTHKFGDGKTLWDIARWPSTHQAALNDLSVLGRLNKILLRDDDFPARLSDQTNTRPVLYRITGENVRLGEGSYGRVHLHESSGFGVAVKTIKAALSREQSSQQQVDAVDTLRREVDSLWGLPHIDFIIKLLKSQLGSELGEVQITLQLACGGDLSRALREQANETAWTRSGARIARQVATGLAHLHEWDVSHHDLKPSNILLSAPLPNGYPILADFGIAGLAGLAVSDNSGSGSYMAPETCEATGEKIDWYKADMYALGVLIWVLLTSPHCADLERESIVPCLYACSRCFPLPPSRRISWLRLNSENQLVCSCCGVDRLYTRVSPLVSKCIDFEPENRPSARAVLSELKQLEFAGPHDAERRR